MNKKELFKIKEDDLNIFWNEYKSSLDTVFKKVEFDEGLEDMLKALCEGVFRTGFTAASLLYKNGWNDEQEESNTG